VTALENFVEVSDKTGRLAARNRIDALEEAMKKEFGSERGEMDEINDKGLKEYLVHKTYIRELFIPKGVAIVAG
jgi:hypothetical protein